jgi:hypothetical protein
MSAPPDELGQDARALLRAARGGDDVPSEQRHLLLERFARQRAAEAARSQRARSSSIDSRRAAPRFGWAVAALLLSGSLVALAHHQGVIERVSAWLEPTPPAPTAQRSLPRPRAELSPARPHTPLADEVASPAAPTAPSRQAPSPEATPGVGPELGASPGRASAPRAPRLPAPTIDPAELELIAAARSALAERHYDAARQHAERHAARFPRGAFSEEREAILALSDCRSERGSQRGRLFVSERAGSVLAERVRRDCGLDPNLVPSAEAPGTH